MGINQLLYSTPGMALPITDNLVADFNPGDVSSLNVDGSNRCSRTANMATNSTFPDLIQTVDGLKPLSGTRTMNDRNVLDFDGVNDLMFTDSPFTTVPQPYEIFVVYQKDVQFRPVYDRGFLSQGAAFG